MLEIKPGTVFGQLTAIEPCGRKHRSILWECSCICGNQIEVKASYLKNLVKTSCGCGKKGKKNHNWRGYEDISKRYWTSLESCAARRNLPFQISIKYGWDLFLKQKRKCALTGLDLFFIQQVFKNQKDQTASLDRIDSNFGYIEGNVQWVHKKVNQMKLCLRTNELLYWSKFIYEWNLSKLDQIQK